MREIILTNDFMSGLKKLDPELHSESNIYVRDRTLYKIFTAEGYKPSELAAYYKRKEKKIEIISQLENFSHVILPQDKLFRVDGKRKSFCGYSMDYLDSSITLKEASQYLDIKVFIQLLSRISITLKKIHKRSEGIVIADLSFLNILVSEIEEVLDYFFIDFDGVSIGKDLKEDRIPLFTKEYADYRNVRLKINKNYDRLSFLLYFLESVFEKSIIEVSIYEYDKMSERVNILKDLRSLIIELKKTEGSVPSIPYLHEVISSSNKTLKKVS